MVPGHYSAFGSQRVIVVILLLFHLKKLKYSQKKKKPQNIFFKKIKGQTQYDFYYLSGLCLIIVYYLNANHRF